MQSRGSLHPYKQPKRLQDPSQLTCAAALLGLCLQLLSRSLISPSGQGLQPSTAALQWAEEPNSQEVIPEAWAALDISVQGQVSTPGWLYFLCNSNKAEQP